MQGGFMSENLEHTGAKTFLEEHSLSKTTKDTSDSNSRWQRYREYNEGMWKQISTWVAIAGLAMAIFAVMYNVGYTARSKLDQKEVKQLIKDSTVTREEFAELKGNYKLATQEISHLKESLDDSKRKIGILNDSMESLNRLAGQIEFHLRSIYQNNFDALRDSEKTKRKKLRRYTPRTRPPQ